METDADRRIGFFDTGVGGLSVLGYLAAAGAGEEYYYLADRAYRPYGGKSAAEVLELVRKAAYFLIEQGVNELVLACNTATAAAFRGLTRELQIPVWGPIEPAARQAARLCPRGTIGILASELTVKSGQYDRSIKKMAPGSRVIGEPCPGLSSFVEAGEISGPDVEAYLREKIARLEAKGMEVLILGCTHYSFLRELIESLMKNKVPIVDSSRELAASLMLPARQKTGLGLHPSESKFKYFVTAESEQFAAVGAKLLAGRNGLVLSALDVGTITL